MNRKFLAGSALATLLVVPAAALLTLELTRNGLPVGTGEQWVEAIGKDVSKDAETKGAIAVKPATHVAADKQAMSEASSAVAEIQEEIAAKRETGILHDEAYGIARERHAAPSPAGGIEMLTGGSAMRTMPSPSIVPSDIVLPQEESRDRFTSGDTNPVKSVATDPVSTFSADVDTASYSFVRKALMAGEMPDPDSVRVEEMINYFPYDWPGPESEAEPFRATVTVVPTPWNANTRLMHVGIKGYDVAPVTAPRANLVFLIDVSGSMQPEMKLPLVQRSLDLLVDRKSVV